jgi:hypothetical protein
MSAIANDAIAECEFGSRYHRGLCHVEVAEDVRLKSLLRLRLRNVEWSVAALEMLLRRVVDQHVEPAERFARERKTSGRGCSCATLFFTLETNG